MNFLAAVKPQGVLDPANDTSLTPEDQAILRQSELFELNGPAYSQQRGTRPATTGLMLATNPLAVLAW